MDDSTCLSFIYEMCFGFVIEGMMFYGWDGNEMWYKG
jgi:hypothetical protein